MVDFNYLNFESIRVFLSDPLYFRIGYLTVIFFLAAWLVWYIYIQLSQRDLFKLHKPQERKPTFLDKFVYFLKYVFLFPAFTFIWFVVLVGCLIILSAKTDIREIMLLGVVLVSAIRIAAYVNQKMAEDLAKLLPLTLLAGIILNPSFITLDAKISDLLVLETELPAFAKYFLFIIFLELVLRLAKHFFESRN